MERLDADVLPHMGWNTVTPPPGSALFAGISPGTRFYFVHSYALRSPARTSSPRRAPSSPGPSTASRSPQRPSRGSLAATQFHPEKSGDAGAALLSNWLETL